MKNIYRFYALCICILFLGINYAFGAIYSFASSLPSGWTVTSGSIASYETSSYARGACFQTASQITLTGQSGVTSVVITASTNRTDQHLRVHVGGSQLGGTRTISSGTANANTEYTFSGSTLSGNLVVTVDQSNGSIWIKQIVVTTSSGTTPINVTLHYKGTTAALSNQSNPYTLPTTGTYVANACDAWTFDGWYNSSYAKNTSKPTYITQLTSSGSAYAVYKHTEAGGLSGTWVASEQGWENETNASTKTAGDITVSWAQNGGTNPPKYYTSGTAVRAYGKNRFTVSSTKGNISSIVIGFGSSDGSLSISTNTGTYSNGTWTGDASSVTFTVASGSGNRRIASITATGGTTYYSTDAECGPKVQATASPWVTSTQGATVKVEVPVTATNFDKSSTLSASVSGAGFSIVGWGANGNSVTKDVDLTTSLILEYCPTVFSSDATITFNSTYSGSQTPVYTPGTVHGRSLPGLFVIAIKNDGTWYALPANMDGSGTYAGVAVDVDDIDNPTKVTAGPATALYRLTGVHPSRYDDYGTRVRFMSEYNSKCLWSNTAIDGKGINNGALLNNATSDNYEWTLVTSDGVIYAINTNVQQKITEGRELRYRAGESRFGMYTDGNSAFRILPIDCYTRATVSNVETTYNSVTLTWAGKSGTNYNVYIDEGGVTKKTETNVSSPITISGLTPETNYTWIISPGDKDDDCALSGDFTTNVSPISVSLSCDGTVYNLGPQDKPYTLPTSGVYVNDACAEWEFVGWTNDTYNKNTAAPTLITQMTADGTAYAVYRKAEAGSGSEKYVRVTATNQITDGQYLIMCNSYGDADDDTSDDYDYFTAFKGSLTTLDATYNSLTGIKRNTVVDTIGVTSITTANEFTINANSHTIRSASGYYIGRTASSNGLNSSTTTQYTNTMTIDGSGNFICEGSGSNVYLQFYSADERFRYFTSTQKAIQLYKRTGGTTYSYSTSSECCNEVEVPTVVVEPLDVSATISWDNQASAVNGYHVTCTNGTEEDVAAGTTSLLITGLSASTSYDYTVTAKGTTCNRSVEGSFTTSSCSDVPTNVTVTAGTHTATVRWTASAATATVVIYDDEQGTSVVTSETNQTSPCTIYGLNDNTDYYLQVLSGGSCPLPMLKPFRTQATAVSIAEWFPDGIHINLQADEATATVLIEDKQEQQSGSTSYADGLFFSKYYEAYLSVKLWAIYNGTKEKISLANVVVKSANNGNYWAKDNETDTGPENAGKITSLATFGHFETGYIYPGEEIIVYNPGQATGTQDHDIIECMEATYSTAYKDDPDSVWYLVNNQTTSISGDDGLILLNGTDTLDVIGGKNTSAAHAAISQPSWGDAKGWNDSEGTDEEGNVIGLSTNRCLLVRKNTVKNGLNAVAKNTNYFNTISEEWWGKHVPTTGDQVQTSCDNFSYVGHYDYNNYYAHFDSITTVDELTGNKKEDGTYTIPIPQLDTLSCTMLRVKVYEGTEEKASAEYKVPIMIKTTDATTADDDYFHSYARKTNSVAVCKECDVVILKGATLTKASSDDTKDIDEVRDLTIYPGGTLIIPSGAKYDYTVNSLIMRVEGEEVPVAKLSGTLNSKTQQVVVTRRQDNQRPYFFSLPYDCNVSDIRWANGETPVLGTDYRIMTYDGATRAAQGSTNNGRFWTYLTESDVIHAGVGYNIQTPYQYLHELVFPMSLSAINVTNEENNKSITTDIHQYTNAGTTINNHNWNLIAQPYISPFNPQEDGDIRYGYLDYQYNDNGEPIWERKDVTHVYLTMPSFGDSKITYEQKIHDAAGLVLNPFLAMFVQGAGEGDITFDKTNRILSAAPPRHLAAEAENRDESIFVGVTLTTNGKSDQTNVRLRPDFTNEYQLGYDLEKFITYYTERPQVYMVNGSRMAFRAVSDEVAANTAMPMGVYGEYAGTYTFALSADYPTEQVEGVYLTDVQTGQTTNLLYDTYSFQTNGRIYTESRFQLRVVVRRDAPQTATDIETVVSGSQQTRKIIHNGQLYILQGGRVYDATGKQLLNR